MTTVVSLENVSKQFGNKFALRGIDLTVEHGQLTALLGPSGSGKSTLLRHLSGLTCASKAHPNRIEVMGKLVQQNGKLSREIRQVRAHTGYIFQQFNLVNRLDVLTNVLIGALHHTPKWRTLTGNFTLVQKQEALAALARVGMADFARQRVGTLSGGQQQRVAIARSLMQKAKIILADEPIASLDPESSKTVMTLLSEISEEFQIPVIVTLHQVDYAKQYCQEIVGLRQGEVFYQGSSQGLTEQVLSRLYSAENTPEKTSFIPDPRLQASFS
ncbi:phosphonate ABC transporter ATP-binding protein [Salinibius halmophilus]|uniref:phosphonate ABC transporter ATP-binding protein n=1 Tax=Salinibius halmophilus TaxID=1853216 RepID=UPI000E67502A|nr:phosphonate ABC transporter ATP-binding protein [Salinibius halmophilus]